jgi:hypothetical protein
MTDPEDHDRRTAASPAEEALRASEDRLRLIMADSGDGAAVLRVGDTGIGVSPAMLSRLFEEEPMLESLDLRHVGPAPKMGLELKPRMNFLAGDNGLGKSFLLDVAWWALTRTWAREKVIPRRDKDATPAIAYRYGAKTGPFGFRSTFDRKTESWALKQGRPPIPGMVLYAQVDGGFSVWDPARNYWKRDVAPDRPAAYIFKVDEVWNGLREGERSLCEGLIRDWASWQREGGEAYHQLTRVLDRLSPSRQERLAPGRLTRISVTEPVDHPTVVELKEFGWARRGDANAWLTSSVFDLKEPRSVEAEEAITAALSLLRQDSPDLEEVERVDGLLRNSLSDVDRFWVRWSAHRDSLAEGR